MTAEDAFRELESELVKARQWGQLLCCLGTGDRVVDNATLYLLGEAVERWGHGLEEDFFAACQLVGRKQP